MNCLLANTKRVDELLVECALLCTYAPGGGVPGGRPDFGDTGTGSGNGDDTNSDGSGSNGEGNGYTPPQWINPGDNTEPGGYYPNGPGSGSGGNTGNGDDNSDDESGSDIEEQGGDNGYVSSSDADYTYITTKGRSHHGVWKETR